MADWRSRIIAGRHHQMSDAILGRLGNEGLQLSCPEVHKLATFQACQMKLIFNISSITDNITSQLKA